LRARNSRRRPADSNPPDDLHFTIPLDRAMLALHRSPEPAAEGPSSAATSDPECTWKAFYSFHDEARGIEWQLWMQDLTRKAEWERWKILEAERAS